MASHEMSGAYYNEIDPFAVAWLRELIKTNLIAPGEVDERSIETVTADDLRGFTQCHFFAGIGVWSYALRNARWRDDESVWTGSCPCPPFSSAGKQKACPQCDSTYPVPHVGRTGYFVCCLCGHEWFADARHLWPELWRLIRDGRPDKFFGEQVESIDGRTWLTSVRASLEILGYAVGSADISAAGVGAPNIRQRLYFVADPAGKRREKRSNGEQGNSELAAQNGAGNGSRFQPAVVRSSETCSVGDPAEHRLKEQSNTRTVHCTHGPQPEHVNSNSRAISPSENMLLGDTSAAGLSHSKLKTISIARWCSPRRAVTEPDQTSLLSGPWYNADWIYCRDGKYRAVEPGTFPLAHGAAARVGRLRGYGNAINAEVAKTFIEAYMSLRNENAA